MKIRIKGNAVRYRLTRSEVERFAGTGLIEERVNFGSSVLTYALVRTESGEWSATFENNRIGVYLPAVLTDEWVRTDKVGFEHAMLLNGTGETLHLLVEKDYTCLERVAEDQSDNYPNPLIKKSI